MEEYQKRVLEESAELDSRIVRLIAFIKSEAFLKLSIQDQHLLVIQRAFMCSYSNVLLERIANFK